MEYAPATGPDGRGVHSAEKVDTLNAKVPTDVGRHMPKKCSASFLLSVANRVLTPTGVGFESYGHMERGLRMFESFLCASNEYGTPFIAPSEPCKVVFDVETGASHERDGTKHSADMSVPNYYV